ncbi:hypothetical protein ACLKA7_013205 [Drosophila subpalustris]
MSNASLLGAASLLLMEPMELEMATEAAAAAIVQRVGSDVVIRTVTFAWMWMWHGYVAMHENDRPPERTECEKATFLLPAIASYFWAVVSREIGS